MIMIARISPSVARRLASAVPQISPSRGPQPRSVSALLGASNGDVRRPPIPSPSSVLPACVAAAASGPLPYGRSVRFHRIDYGGPGSFDERETGPALGSAQHDHSHSREHHEARGQSAQDEERGTVDEEEKQRIRVMLEARYLRRSGSYDRRGFTVGIGGPVGSGKTALTLALCRALSKKLPMGVVTNDIFTQEDAEFLSRNDALPRGRIAPVETGGCPHAAIREDVSANLGALESLTGRIRREEGGAGDGPGGEDRASGPLLLCESGGDNLAANFSSELADYTVYVIDVAGGDKVPRKGGPGITQSDLLVINKIDLAEAVGASLEVMERDANEMRRRGAQKGGTGKPGPTVFASVKNGVGLDDIITHIMGGYDHAGRLVESAR